jgi:WhiB family redox-sensing transcriptional regulator
MPDGNNADNEPVRLLPVTMPARTGVPLGDWNSLGLCVGEDPDVFFPSNGDPGAKAREICGGCAVRTQCLDYAVETDEFGIWGGLDQDERRNLRRRQRRRRVTGHNPSDRPQRPGGTT